MRPRPYDQGRHVRVAFFSRKGKGLCLQPRRQAVGASVQARVTVGPAYFPFHFLKSIPVFSLQLDRILKWDT